MASTLKLKQVRSANRSSRKQRDSLRTLGLGGQPDGAAATELDAEGDSVEATA